MDMQEPALTRTEKFFLACSTLSPDPLTADALTLSRLRIYVLGRIYRENLLVSPTLQEMVGIVETLIL